MRRPETWQTTDLWKTLERREDDEAAKAKLTVTNILPEVEEILAKGNSTPDTYTLHDEEHSYRVAELIAGIAGDLLQRLSSYEVAMLLLAAYLHDIGMTPPAGKVAAHFSYLLSGDSHDLSEEQREELQVFLDDNWDGRVPPLNSSIPTAEEIALVGRITTAYVRERHNSWGGEWMEQNLQPHADDLYAGWLNDLILLCASHHYGIDELRHSDFHPRLVGAGDCVCHLRFCACLLRVADVLDFDPERTPKVLFAHREVEDGSVIHWHKNHGIGFSLSDDEVTVHAQPSDAVTHHAVICTVEDVERELLLCDRLDQETQFHRMQGWAKDLPHEWRLRTHVQRQINPRGDRYEYVDGTFRPDPGRVLDLIGGAELYGESLAGVRELLQNAFDAVREQIARERLKQSEPNDEETVARLARNHQVLLRLEQDNGTTKLVCRDSGSGMTKEILLSRFLVGGKTANHEIRDLERRCRELGFSVGRTARFGIGVLSYFLLGKRLQLETRRSIEAGGADGVGWSFSSNGLEDFGEVSANSASPQGTTVTLTIKDEFLGDGYEAFAERLCEYLLDTVCRTPCGFRFEVEGAEVEEINLEPGWAEREANVRGLLLRDLRDSTPLDIDTPVELLSREDREGIARQDAYWESLREEAAGAMHLLSEEGELPDELGIYRIFTGYFALGDNLSVAFLDLEDQDDEDGIQIRRVGHADMYVCSGALSTSWNGMEVDTEFDTSSPRMHPDVPSSVIEIDWTSDAAGQLAVDRNSVRLSKKGEQAVRSVGKRARDLLAAMVKEAGESPLSLLNARLVKTDVPEGSSNLQWILDTPQGRKLRPVPFPVRSLHTYVGRELNDGVLLGGKKVTAVRAATSLGGRTRNPHWHGEEFVPSRIALVRSSEIRPVAIWDGAERPADDLPTPKTMALEFPGSFEQMIGVTGTDRQPVWNRDHPVVRALDQEGWNWVFEVIEKDSDPLSYADQVLQSAGRAAAWIVYCLWASEEHLWNGLCDRAPEFLPSLWALIDGLEPDQPLFFYKEQFVERNLRIVSPESWEEIGRDALDEWLEEKTAELDDFWWLTPVKSPLEASV
ncbi:MAG TPA: HD domain-containing protein [Solirubrobacterales bacterium]|nr:HD domain-containing protein [Solirubrobacterales bacterium]